MGLSSPQTASAIVVLGLGIAGPALGSQISVELSGSAYEGGPAFELLLGEAVIGSGVVDVIPQEGEGISFTFPVTEGQLASGNDLRLRLTNDRFDGPGKDRNLHILEVRVGDRSLSLDDIQIVRDGTRVVRPLKAGHLDIWSGTEVAVASPPAGGWLGEGQAAARSVAIAEATCTSATISVGFAMNGTELDFDQFPEISAVLDQARSGNCGVTISGYASLEGDEAVNRELSLARAQRVLDYLVQQGARFTSQDVFGLGETDEFGVGDTDNRRVVVEIR